MNEGIYHYGDTLDEETLSAIKSMNDATMKRKLRIMRIVEIVFNSFFFNNSVTFPILAGKFVKKPYDERYEGLAR